MTCFSKMVEEQLPRHSDESDPCKKGLQLWFVFVHSIVAEKTDMKVQRRSKCNTICWTKGNRLLAKSCSPHWSPCSDLFTERLVKKTKSIFKNRTHNSQALSHKDNKPGGKKTSVKEGRYLHRYLRTYNKQPFLYLDHFKTSKWFDLGFLLEFQYNKRMWKLLSLCLLLLILSCAGRTETNQCPIDASSCDECIQAGPHCAWCSQPFSRSRCQTPGALWSEGCHPTHIYNPQGETIVIMNSSRYSIYTEFNCCGPTKMPWEITEEADCPAARDPWPGTPSSGLGSWL